MEEHFLSYQVEGKPGFRAEPWYNLHGDCLIFQMADEAVVAERVDDVLTIYCSAINDRPIGYQIKGVSAIIRKFGWDGLQVTSENDEQKIHSISVTAILLAAYESGPLTVHRRQAYAQAMNPAGAHSIPRDELQLV